jgi:hypothetical protein
LLGLLLCERLDHVYADDVLLGDRGDVGHLLLHVAEQRVRDVAVPIRERDQQGEDRERNERELHAHDEHHDRDADDREDVLEEEDQPVAEKEAHALQVDGRARHQLSGLMAVVERERKPDEPRVQRRPHVHLDGEGLTARDQSSAHHREGPDCADAEHRRDQRHELMPMAVADDVDDVARQVDDHERRGLRGDREDDRDPHRELVRPQEPEQTDERAAIRRARLVVHPGTLAPVETGDLDADQVDGALDEAAVRGRVHP